MEERASVPICSSMADLEIELTATTATASSDQTFASTSISILHSPDYDVFINHRGPDVKNTFASHLYRRLLQRGLQVFLDKPELQEGLNLTSQIQGAIRSATVHVAIFSPRYAESKWCLDELLQMLETGAPIIPVFYHVKPAQLRWTQGDGGIYSEDLRKFEEKKTYDTETDEEKPRHDPITIKKWREALSHVAEISGFELDASYTDEGELLDKIVERVVKNVKTKDLDEEVKDSENTALLEQEQQPCSTILGNIFGVFFPLIWGIFFVAIFFLLIWGIFFLLIWVISFVAIIRKFIQWLS